MKKLFVIILFVIFVNVFIIMFNASNIFPTDIDPSGNYSDVTSGSSAEDVLYDVNGYDFGDIMSIIFVDVNSDSMNILSSVLMLGGAALLAWLTRSPAPFVIAVVTNVFKNTYVNSIGFMEQFGVNDYMMMAGLIGMIILLVVTCLEYLTHGDA